MTPALGGVLLVDYGEVISEPQPARSIAAMASIADLDLDEFTARYWRNRPAYDKGGQASTFWGQVTGSDPVEGQTLQELIRLDIESWLVLNAATLELLMDAQRDGWSPSVLSNAPHELAVTLSRHPALAFFDHLIFSAWIGAIKPEPAAFEAAVNKLSRAPHEILFIDDRPANVQGAIEAGLQGLQFTSAAELRTNLWR